MRNMPDSSYVQAAGRIHPQTEIGVTSDSASVRVMDRPGDRIGDTLDSGGGSVLSVAGLRTGQSRDMADPGQEPGRDAARAQGQTDTADTAVGQEPDMADTPFMSYERQAKFGRVRGLSVGLAGVALAGQLSVAYVAPGDTWIEVYCSGGVGVCGAALIASEAWWRSRKGVGVSDLVSC